MLTGRRSRPLHSLLLWLLVWLAGAVLLPGGRQAESPFRLEWQRDFGEGSHFLQQGSRGGIYLQSFHDGSVRLRSIGSDGNDNWSRDTSYSIYFDEIREYDDMICFPTRDGGLVALDYSGEEIWSFRPLLHEYESLLAHGESPAADLFVRIGVLIYGVSMDGGACWVVNSAQPSIGNRIPLQLDWGAEPAALIFDTHTVRMLHADGGITDLDPAAVLESGPAANGRRPGTLQIKDQTPLGLVFANRSECVLYRPDGEVVILEASGMDAGGFHAENIICGTEDRILLPMPAGCLSEYDSDGRRMWSWSAHDRGMLQGMRCNDGYVLLHTRIDKLSQGLLRSGKWLPVVEQLMLQSITLPAHATIPAHSEALGFSLIRDGELAGELDLGNWERQYNLNIAASDGEYIYLMRDDRQLECYSLEQMQ